MIKREAIENVLKDQIEDENKLKKLVDDVMREVGKHFKDTDQKIDTLETTKESLETQLKEAKDEMEKLTKADTDVEEMTKKINELTKKYDEDTKALNDKLSQKTYEYKVKELVNDLKFSSKSAKENFLRKITEEKLKLENDTLIGFNDFVNSYKKNDPQAFVVEEKKKDDKVYNLGDSHKNDKDTEPKNLREALRENYKK